jgi:hypothetical protein
MVGEGFQCGYASVAAVALFNRATVGHGDSLWSNHCRLSNGNSRLQPHLGGESTRVPIPIAGPEACLVYGEKRLSHVDETEQNRIDL